MAFDIMVDLETLGTRTDTVFVSIGAVAFDRFGTDVPVSGPRTFYRNVDIQSCIDLGLRVDGSTVYWWLRQSEDARRAICDPKPIPVRDALAQFAQWYKGQSTKWQTSPWSHGATFDLPIISEACARMGLKPPYDFWECNDTRTIFRDAGVKLSSADTREGGHNSLQDAIAQARHLQHCLRLIHGRSAHDVSSKRADTEALLQNVDLEEAASDDVIEEIRL